MKKFIILLFLQLSLTFHISTAVNPLELRLRNIRDNYRYSPGEALPEIEKIWREFSSENDRAHIFLDLNHYYIKHSLSELLLKQGTWLIKQNSSGGIKGRIWIMIPVAETYATLGKINRSIECYEKAFTLGCGLLGKNPKNLSREDFIRTGVEGTAIFGKTVKNTALNFAKAGKFNDAYNILRSSKTMSTEDDFDPEEITQDSEKNMIIILGIFEKKYIEACRKLELSNDGNPYLVIENDTEQTPEEKICLKAKNYELLADIYINTLIINPPCEFITYQKIVINSRSTVYILNKILNLLENDKFSVSFEKALKRKIKTSNLAHLNILFAEYYSYRKNHEQAYFYYQEVIKQGKNQIYRWPKYYPDLNLNENYKSPHRLHLWQTCYERAKGKLNQIGP